MGAVKVGSSSGEWIRSCVFLLLSERPAHGYELLQNLDNVGAHGVDSGTLYRVLRRAERDGMTRSEWHAAELGPTRRVYELTERGQSALKDATADYVEALRLIENFVDRTRAHRKPSANSSR